MWHAKKIDDAAGPALAALKSLKTVDLADTSIGDAGLASLSAIPGLRNLYLTGSHVTDAGVQTFLQQRPNCKVSWK